MKYIALLSILALSTIGNSQGQEYLPASVDDHQRLTYTQFTLSYNELHEQADWVAYKLTKDEAKAKMDRCNCFKSDLNIATGSASGSDYTSGGFDRGHLCPAGDCNMSELANRESFLFSNMSPQSPLFNRKQWVKLEDWIRKQAIRYDSIYIATGPVFFNNLGSIGNNEVTIPGYFYKTVMRIDKNGSVKTIAFLIPQIGFEGNFRDYVVSVNTIETLTGIDFYPDLPSSIENSVESTVSVRSWRLHREGGRD